MAKKKNANPQIQAGSCGFRGCNEERLGGVWVDGGSYMCEPHKERLAPVREAMKNSEDPYGVRDRLYDPLEDEYDDI